MTRPLLTAVLASLALLSPVQADWLSFRGPLQQGVSPETGFKSQFSSDGPAVLWKTRVGVGTSAVTVSGNRAFTMGNNSGKDTVVCLDVKTGAVVWKHEYPLALDKRMFEGGTAATPTLDSGRVYTLSHQGDLFCLDAATGQKIWYKHLQQDLGGKRPQWGFAGSPTIDGDLLFVDVGARKASTVALNKATGAIVWKSGDDDAGYAAPVVAQIDGKRTVVMFKASHLVGLDVKDGRELWRDLWKTNYDVNAATPLVVGDRIYISSGYGTGGCMVEVKGGKVSQKWRNRHIKAHISSPVYSKGFIYGIDGDARPDAPLVCLDFNTGAKKWEERNIGGALIAADGKLIILSELGELIIAEETAAGFKPITRAQVLPKRCWVQPTLDSGRIYCRNNQGELVCLDAGMK